MVKPFLSATFLQAFFFALFCFIAARLVNANTALVVCGGGNKNKKCLYGPKLVSKSETYGARCCSKKQFYPLSVKQPGCRVYGGTITDIPGPGLEEGGEEGLYCPRELTYAEAELHCTNLGARICTEQELANRCAKSTGCHLNWEYVWSHSPAKNNLSQDECYSLPYASIFNPGGFVVTDEKLPYGCQMYFDPNAPEFNRMIYNLANENVEPFSNLQDITNAHCTTGSCVSSYSVMQVWIDTNGSALTQGECALLPDASESNAGGFLGSWQELPYGCQKLFNPDSTEEERIIFNLANQNVGVFSNLKDAKSTYCTSGWCIGSYSVMQVWSAPQDDE